MIALAHHAEVRSHVGDALILHSSDGILGSPQTTVTHLPNMAGNYILEYSAPHESPTDSQDRWINRSATGVGLYGLFLW